MVQISGEPSYEGHGPGLFTTLLNTHRETQGMPINGDKEPGDGPPIIGGGGMGVNTGNRAIFYPDVRYGSDQRRELLNLWSTYGVTLGEAAADRAGTLAGFGDPGARLAGGVLPELLV